MKLEVDGVTAPIGQGKPGVSAADTNDPLFIGGAPGKKNYLPLFSFP